MGICNFIKEKRKSANISKWALSKISGVAYGYIGQIESGGVIQPSPGTLRKLAGSLPNTTYFELMKEAGYLDGIEGIENCR